MSIYRNGKWDLPKGGCDKGEAIEDCSIREVEEETGVSRLKISNKLQKTYHIFKRNGVYRLKITHWFEMKTDFEGELIPQANEGIEKVAWLNPEEIKQALNNSYENIKLLFVEENENNSIKIKLNLNQSKQTIASRNFIQSGPS